MTALRFHTWESYQTPLSGQMITENEHQYSRVPDEAAGQTEEKESEEEEQKGDNENGQHRVLCQGQLVAFFVNLKQIHSSIV